MGDYLSQYSHILLALPVSLSKTEMEVKILGLELLLLLLLLLVTQSAFAMHDKRKYHKRLPAGYDFVDNELVDITNKVIQVVEAHGCKYYAFDDTDFTTPIYIRDKVETGFHFIVFDDPYNQDPGAGHYIVLQRLSGLSVGFGQPKTVYEAYLLQLEDSLGADVEPYDPKETEYYEDEESEKLKNDFERIRSSF